MSSKHKVQKIQTNNLKKQNYVIKSEVDYRMRNYTKETDLDVREKL